MNDTRLEKGRVDRSSTGTSFPYVRSGGHISRVWLACLSAPLLFLAAATAEGANGSGDSSMSITNAGPVGISIQFNDSQTRTQVSSSIKIVLLMTALSLAPSAIIMMTSFMRILIVLGFLRQAIGLPQTPPGQILASMALFLTIFIMMPIWQKINTESLQPYMEERIDGKEAWEKGVAPLRSFMLQQTGEKELGLFVELSRKEPPKSVDEIPLEVVVPSFMLSELKTAFQMGVLVYLPFLVIDLIISTTLMSLGMMMLPPMMISLPIKMLFFVLADGWTLVVRGMIASFKV